MLQKQMITLMALIAVCCAAATAATTTVDNATDLKNALFAAGDGDVILVAPGSYGTVYFTKGYDFATPVTVRAADRTNPPMFTFVKISNMKGVTFDGLSFLKSETVPDNGYYSLVDMYPSENVTFEYCRFVGSTITDGDQAGFGSGFAFKIRGCTNTIIRRCVFTNLSKCISTATENGITIDQNYAYDFRQDFIYVGGSNINITDNIAADTVPYKLPGGTGDHPDMIQGGDLGNTVISNNFFRGDCQGIFCSGTNGNNTVTNNILQVANRNALMMNNSPDSLIAFNTVLGTESEYFATVEATYASQATIVEYNIGDKINTDAGTDVTYRDNYSVQRDDENNSNYYSDVFVNALADADATIADYKLLDTAFGSPAVTPGADQSQLFWLSAGNPSDPTNELYPMWQQIDEPGRQKLMRLLSLPYGNLTGDANGDGTVDLDDFIILKQNYGRSDNVTTSEGDFNNDGVVDLDDFILLKQNYGSSL